MYETQKKSREKAEQLCIHCCGPFTATDMPQKKANENDNFTDVRGIESRNSTQGSSSFDSVWFASRGNLRGQIENAGHANQGVGETMAEETKIGRMSLES